MSVVPSPRRSALIARTEVRRSFRSFTDNRTRLALTALSTLVVALVVAGGAYGAYQAGRAVRGGGLAEFDVLPALRGFVGLAWVGLTALAAARAVAQRGEVPEADGLLTTVPTRDALGGMLLSELAFVLLWVLPAVWTLTASFSYGAGTPGPFLATLPVAVTLGALAVAVGYGVGLLVRQLVTRYEFLARHRQALFALAFLGYFALVFSGGLNVLGSTLFDPLSRTPVGWLADLLLLGTPGIDPSLARAAAAPVLVLAAVAPAFAGTLRVASVHWFADPATGSADSDEEVNGATGGRFPDLALPMPSSLSRPTRAVAAAAWRRAVRAPIKLAYVVYPLFGVVPVAQTAVEQGRVPAEFPYLVVLYGGWAAGVLVTLNVFGDQGSVLPSTLTTPVSGRQFVAGHVLVGAGVAVPITALLTLATGVASPLSLSRVALLTAAGAVLATVTPLLATGIGALFPRQGSVKVVGNRTAVMPSKRAFLTYSAAFAAAVAAGGLAVEATLREFVAAVLPLLHSALAVSPATLELVGASALVVLLASPFASAAYAARRFDSYTLD
ncbi:hypothetical protein G9464_09335 [Halostella sp. JP-L12]|uniref:hypothetical protein n=1 Tax=Halostella TaxID=1843185 RepID=UPI000EF844EC|nr:MULTISPECIES: hypothetical protein [Halostella]NHN47797.1 hypothetical protein [Halostella sp. JP-L12]